MTRGVSVALVFALVAGCAAPPAVQGGPASAARIERRLLAPCCWNQTLDIHESDLATSLRTEIRQRVAQGEAAEHIEQDMVARYGERVRATPSQRDPLLAIALAVSALFALIALWLLTRAKRSTEQRAQDPAIPTSERDAAYNERIERELRELDD